MTTETKTLTHKTIRLNAPTKYRSIPISLSLHLDKKETKPTPVNVKLNPSTSVTTSSLPPSKGKDDFGLCEECNKPNSSKNYCSSCFSSHLQNHFDKWTSDNNDIDNLIKSSQIKQRRVFIEWIPYDDLRDVKYVAKGGFSTIYSAFWTKGQIINWNQSKEDWNRSGEIKVALKRLYNSQNISQDFLHEFEVSLLHCSGHQHEEIMPIYGITQDLVTKDYMIVTKFIEQGNLRNFIYNNFFSLSWLQKLELLHSIAIGLDKIHSSRLSHNNIHSGNVLVNEKGALSAIISDLGSSGPADKSYDLHNSKIDIFGVIQHTPPEILRGCVYKQYSDIYFFAMLMYEISTGTPPFISTPRDQLDDLVFDICDGFRPTYNFKVIPKCFEELMKQCWNDDEFSRPLASQLVDIIGNWINEIKEDNNSDICKQFNKNGQGQIRLKYSLHKYDIYKSQRIKTTKLGYEDYNDDENDEIMESAESDEGVELAQNNIVTLKRRSDLMKWIENIDDTFDPNQLYPR